MSIAGGRAGAAQVIGDGPAALTAAIALAQRGWAVDLSTRAQPATGRRRIDVLGESAFGALARLGISAADMRTIAQPCPGTWSRWGMDAHSLDHVRMLCGAWAVDKSGLVNLLTQQAIGVGVRFHDCRWQEALPPIGDAESGPWRIVATGSPTLRSGGNERDRCDDKLLALVGAGKLAAVHGQVDSRLLIEAGHEGWSYCVAGPRRSVCVGVITDAQSLHGRQPRAFATRVLAETERIASVLNYLDGPLNIRGTSVVCGQRSLKAGRRSIRVGDAHIGFDPLAGRGLWNAITRTERIAAELHEHPANLDDMEPSLRAEYAQHLLQRATFYLEGHARFGTGFWARRMHLPGVAGCGATR